MLSDPHIVKMRNLTVIACATTNCHTAGYNKQESRMAYITADEASLTVLVMFKKMSRFQWLKMVHLVF